MKAKKFNSSEGNVWKYVFEFEKAVAETVLYRYENFYERTVLCISVQSGCPVGCNFCGTGKKFLRNLTSSEMVAQVDHVLTDMNIVNTFNIKKFQIMFMSMGEPMLNYENVKEAIKVLNSKHINAQLLISTVAPKKTKEFLDFIELSKKISKIGLQFSIHEANDKRRDELIPYKNKFNLREIRDLGILWHENTNRNVYLNYCISDDNHELSDINRLKDLFPPTIFNLTFSVICSSDENLKDKGFKELSIINKVSNSFMEDGYNVRVFDPAGQDDIGGGCGQLWYTQEYMKNL